ncbi:MAG TPA: zinc ribbon domain-containing protein [Pyrinomonadaceae bacterium]|nr:zinc ribbon domain-containing protein [Pyrinomonadaceae bacterium]
MYCPKCGQQQLSDEMRFCSRCGLALSGLASWLAGGYVPATRADEPQLLLPSQRSKGIRRAAKLMFLSGALFPVFLVISLAIDEAAPMVFPCILFFVALVWMLYARLFGDNTPQLKRETYALGSIQARSSLPAASQFPMPPMGEQQVRTNELATPPSVTERTTRFLDSDSAGEFSVEP